MIRRGLGELHLRGVLDALFIYFLSGTGLVTGGVLDLCLPGFAMVLMGWAPWNGSMALKGNMGNGGGGIPIAGLKIAGLIRGMAGAGLPLSGMFDGSHQGTLNVSKVGGFGN